MSKRKSALKRKDAVIAVRVPRAWVKALKGLETEEVKQPLLIRRAIRRFLHGKKALK